MARLLLLELVSVLDEITCVPCSLSVRHAAGPSQEAALPYLPPRRTPLPAISLSQPPPLCALVSAPTCSWRSLLPTAPSPQPPLPVLPAPFTEWLFRASFCREKPRPSRVTWLLPHGSGGGLSQIRPLRKSRGQALGVGVGWAGGSCEPAETGGGAGWLSQDPPAGTVHASQPWLPFLCLNSGSRTHLTEQKTEVLEVRARKCWLGCAPRARGPLQALHRSRRCWA